MREYEIQALRVEAVNDILFAQHNDGQHIDVRDGCLQCDNCQCAIAKLCHVHADQR